MATLVASKNARLEAFKLASIMRDRGLLETFGVSFP